MAYQRENETFASMDFLLKVVSWDFVLVNWQVDWHCLNIFVILMGVFIVYRFSKVIAIVLKLTFLLSR